MADKEVKKGKVELSEEDAQLKEELEVLVGVVTREDGSVESKEKAVKTMAEMVQTATMSMSSVPKPIKFLRVHFKVMKEAFEKMPGESELKRGTAKGIMC